MDTDEADCFLFNGKLLCEECGLAEQDDIHDGSGKPAMFWTHVSSVDYPQRAIGPANATCAVCGWLLGAAYDAQRQPMPKGCAGMYPMGSVQPREPLEPFPDIKPITRKLLALPPEMREGHAANDKLDALIHDRDAREGSRPGIMAYDRDFSRGGMCDAPD